MLLQSQKRASIAVFGPMKSLQHSN